VLAAAAIAIGGCGRIGFDSQPTGDALGSAGDAAYATPMVLQTPVNGASAATTTTLTLSPSAPGSLLVLALGAFGPPAPVTSVTDNRGTTYVSANASASTGSGRCEIWYAPNTSGGVTSIVVTWSTATNTELWGAELAGMDAAPLDNVGTQSNGTLTNPVSAPTVTTSTPKSFVLSVIGGVNAVGAVHPPFTALMTLSGDDMAYATVTTAGTYGAVWDDTNTGAYESSTAAFKAAVQ
jgi:hypothetical protein